MWIANAALESIQKVVLTCCKGGGRAGQLRGLGSRVDEACYVRAEKPKVKNGCNLGGPGLAKNPRTQAKTAMDGFAHM